MTMQKKYVRIRSYNKAQGCLVRRFMYDGKRFDCDHPGWYTVSAPIADELAKITNTSTGALVFDVVSKVGAKNIEEAELTEEWSSGRDTVETAEVVADSEFRQYYDKVNESREAPVQPAVEDKPKAKKASKKTSKKRPRRSQTK